MKTKKKATKEGESSRPSTSHRKQAAPPPTQANPTMHPLEQNQFNQLSKMIQHGFEKLVNKSVNWILEFQRLKKPSNN